MLGRHSRPYLRRSTYRIPRISGKRLNTAAPVRVTGTSTRWIVRRSDAVTAISKATADAIPALETALALDPTCTWSLRELADIVTPAHVITDADAKAGYEVDWTGRFRGATPAVVRPGSVEEVAAVVDVCQRDGVAIVAQGGNTGMVGGGVPLAGELVMSLRRLDHVEPVDTAAQQVTVGAGATVEALQRAAAEAATSARRTATARRTGVLSTDYPPLAVYSCDCGPVEGGVLKRSSWLDVLTDRRAPLAVSPAMAPADATGSCYSVETTAASINAPSAPPKEATMSTRRNHPTLARRVSTCWRETFPARGSVSTRSPACSAKAASARSPVP